MRHLRYPRPSPALIRLRQPRVRRGWLAALDTRLCWCVLPRWDVPDRCLCLSLDFRLTRDRFAPWRNHEPWTSLHDRLELVVRRGATGVVLTKRARLGEQRRLNL